MSEEFSHTILHGEKIANKLQPKPIARPPSRPIATPVSRATPEPRPSSAIAPKLVYDASKIYRAPVVPVRKPSAQVIRKSAEKKPPIIQPAWEKNRVKTPSMADEQRKRPQDSKEDLVPVKKLLDSLSEKQKADRMKKARELAVQNVLVSAYDIKADEAKPVKVISIN